MRRFIIIASLLFPIMASAQNVKGVPTYDPSGQPRQMQYFKPISDKQFVGDCIPFYDNGTFYLYWLLDEGHHSSLNGLGAHQWCLSTSKDLIHWTHYPIAIGIDEEWEKSICTGSVVRKGDTFYAFYATRRILEDGSVNEQLSYATSKDGLHYVKHEPNPFYTSAPGYSKRSFRDPKVIVDEKGRFHLFVTSWKDEHAMNDDGGCLVHLVSSDLENWDVLDPLISGKWADPECSDYFFWNGWYYLIYGQGGDTYYLKSRQPYGPWEYPNSQALLEHWVNVAKTAYFGNGRRIVAGWIPSKNEDKDDGYERFGGNVVLREAYQLPNGDLATHFPEEVIPATGPSAKLNVGTYENADFKDESKIMMDARGKTGSICFKDLPANCRITLKVSPETNVGEYGLILKASGKADGYKLALNSNNEEVTLHNTEIKGVTDLSKPVTLDVIIYNDIIDVCIDNRRCIVNRLGEKQGDDLWLYARDGKLAFRDLKVNPIK